jgi:multiple antibiotic resistance protein
MHDAITFGILSFTSLFTIVDPIAAAPVFVALTDNCAAAARRAIAIKACLVALGILLVFAISGSFIFQLFGITIDALRIAGGILFFLNAMQILTSVKQNTATVASPEVDLAIVPLAMPVICGPGAISTVMVLMGQQKSVWHLASFFTALILVLVATAIVLILAPRIVRFLGQTGVTVVTKVIGLLMAVIGIQLIIDGLRPIVLGILGR